MTDCSALPTVENTELFEQDAGTINEVVTSSDPLTSPASDGKQKKTLAGMAADAAAAIQGVGFINKGEFSTLPTIENSNEVAVFEGNYWLPTEPLPYTATGSSPLLPPEADKWAVAVTAELLGIARSLNVLNSDVTYDTAGIVVASYIYSAGQQKIYTVPSGAIGSAIVSVVSNTLNTSSGTYALIDGAGNVEIKTPESFQDSHALIKSAQPGATRIHQEPNGNIESGTTAKYDWMFDPYDADPNNYRIFSSYTYVGDPNGTGEGAVGVINAKSSGAAWGNWPSVHFSFSDDSASPMKMMYFDTSDTEWRTPMKGMWHTGKSINAGDYVTASNNIYKATTAGVTGATIPSHSSGTVSDGGVSWVFDYSPDGASVKPCMVFGERDEMPMFDIPNVRAQFLSPIAMGRGAYFDFVGDNDFLHSRLQPRTGSGSEKLTELITQDGVGRLILDSTNNYLQTSGLGSVKTAKVQNSTDSPDVSGTELVRFGNTSAQDIVRFNGAVADQVFMVDTTTSGSGFTTIKGNGSSIKLVNDGVDIVLTEFTVLMFKMNWDGTRAIQI